jgi:hypothetical protein
MQTLADELASFFNGDWAAPVLQHWCFEPGCCNGHDVEVSQGRALTLLLQSVVRPIGQKVGWRLRTPKWKLTVFGAQAGAWSSTCFIPPVTNLSPNHGSGLPVVCLSFELGYTDATHESGATMIYQPLLLAAQGLPCIHTN